MRSAESSVTSESPPDFDPEPILRVLLDADVDFVVTGGVAGGAHGSAYPTYDLDVAYSRDSKNLERLAAALRTLGARLRGAPPDVPFLLDAKMLATGANFTFTTPFGSFDVLADAAGAPPYEQLRADAKVERLGGRPIRFASLDHLIAMKEASARTKDKLMATEYRMLSDEIRRDA
jgi:hypothetical protein